MEYVLKSFSQKSHSCFFSLFGVGFMHRALVVVDIQINPYRRLLYSDRVHVCIINILPNIPCVTFITF